MFLWDDLALSRLHPGPSRTPRFIVIDEIPALVTAVVERAKRLGFHQSTSLIFQPCIVIG